MLLILYNSKYIRNKSADDDLFEAYISVPLDEDEDFIYDWRNTNSGSPGKNFSEFYKESDALLDEYGNATGKRCHLEVVHMPVAVSVNQLDSTFVRIYGSFT